ncbi:MAG: hypothetical protein KKD92_03015 [Proteobacteria bacterium]|nr:hypothetical protein [Pseudomonadota bacterium]
MDLTPKYLDVADKLSVLLKTHDMSSFCPRFQKAAERAITISPAVDLARREFLSICIGNKPSSQFNKALCFPIRFLGGSWKSEITKESCSKSIQEIFDLGFLNHFSFTEFPTRNNFQTIDSEQLRNQWIPKSLLAPMKMQEYSEVIVPQVPIEGFFIMWYENAVKKLVKSSWKIGRLKRQRVYSYFRATFITGLMLALEYDLATKKYKQIIE